MAGFGYERLSRPIGDHGRFTPDTGSSAGVSPLLRVFVGYGFASGHGLKRRLTAGFDPKETSAVMASRRW